MATFYETKLGDLYVSSQDNLEFPVHLHALLEIVHVCSGRLTMMIDRQRFVLETGEVGVVFPNQIHGYETDTSNRTGAVFISFLHSWGKLAKNCSLPA